MLLHKQLREIDLKIGQIFLTFQEYNTKKIASMYAGSVVKSTQKSYLSKSIDIMLKYYGESEKALK